MATFTVTVSACLPQLASSPQHALKSMSQYNGLKCFQMPKKISMQARSVAGRRVRPLGVVCQSTIEQVQDIIATQLSVDRASVQPQTKFSDLGADSLDTVEIVMALEEKFGVSIGEQDAENISTVEQVADLIQKQSVAS